MGDEAEPTAEDSERYEVPLWDLAPDRWVEPDEDWSFRVKNAEVVGDAGSERLVYEIERYREPDERGESR